VLRPAHNVHAVDGVKFLVVEMTPVTRSDSSGAHFIHDLAKDLKAQGIQLVLCNPTDVVSAQHYQTTTSAHNLQVRLKQSRNVQWRVWGQWLLKQEGWEGGS
jgi:anti-anti-sigma regulatory factor